MEAIMEGGEWNSFNVNEEANFMAHLFPTNCSSPSNDAEDVVFSLAAWSNTANSDLYSSFSQDSCYSGGIHDSYYTSDDSHQFLAANKVEDLGCCLDEETDNSRLSDKNPWKRSRASDVPNGKRNASKRRKGGLEEDNNNGILNRKSSSSCSSDEESNLSLELNNRQAASLSALNSSGKTRASRGSATDPQSLYARKRRERINERLRILQSLVPNGTKVDISTMLEEAVEYVKFLQLQIKLLSSEDLWMYAPIAYNGMDIGLDLKTNLPK
ncbi:hypothetical protein V2J09_014105 [Rumex salicifolius]